MEEKESLTNFSLVGIYILKMLLNTGLVFFYKKKMWSQEIPVAWFSQGKLKVLRSQLWLEGVKMSQR